MDRALPVALQDLLNRDLRLPVCPLVFIRLMEALQSDGNADLAEILSSDPSLMSQVLRVSNSAFYGLTRQVRSINEAVMRIGINEIWSIASALKAKELFHSNEGEWSQLNCFLWEHSLTTGAMVRSMNKRLKINNGDEIFTAALLHDLGKSVLHTVEPQYAALCKAGALSGPELTAREQDFFGTNHARLGGELLRHWNLPVNLSSLVGGHHDHPPADDHLKKSRYVLALANNLANELIPAPEGTPPTFRNPPKYEFISTLGVDDAACAQIAAEAQRQLAILKKF